MRARIATSNLASSLAKVGGTVLAVFAVVSGVAQTLALEKTLRFATLGLTVIASLAAFVVFRRVNAAAGTLACLDAAISPDEETRLVPATCDAAVREIWRMDIANFQTHTVPTDVGVEWWKRYKDGLYALRRDGELCGYVSFWPLARSSFESFVSGKLLESHINAACIVPPTDTAACSWWYLGSIAVVPKYRRTGLVKELVGRAATQWVSKLRPSSQVNICALAYSPEGSRLLHKLGFYMHADATESPHGLPVFVQQTNVTEILEMIERKLKFNPQSATTRKLESGQPAANG